MFDANDLSLPYNYRYSSAWSQPENTYHSKLLGHLQYEATRLRTRIPGAAGSDLVAVILCDSYSVSLQYILSWKTLTNKILTKVYARTVSRSGQVQ